MFDLYDQLTETLSHGSFAAARYLLDELACLDGLPLDPEQNPELVVAVPTLSGRLQRVYDDWQSHVDGKHLAVSLVKLHEAAEVALSNLAESSTLPPVALPTVMAARLIQEGTEAIVRDALSDALREISA